MSRSRTTRPLGALVATLGALLATAGTASAHGAVGGGFEAPIPLALLYGGAGATVAITAGWLAVGGRSVPELADDSTLVVGPAGARLLRIGGRVLGLSALLAIVLGGLVGPQVQSENVATVLFWPVWLKGLGLVAIVAGSPWRVVSPWETLYAVLARIEGDDPASLGRYPDRLGVWPALLGYLLLVGVVENLTTLPRSPRLTAALVAGYALVMVAGALAFGPVWLRRADPLAVLYDLLGRVAPLSIRRADDGGYRLTLRAPWRACMEPVTDASVVAFAIAALYTVSFDGLTNTATFQTVLATLAAPFGPTPTATALYVVGFAWFLASFTMAVVAVERLGGGRAVPGAVATAFVGSVLPIAAAYEVAHTYPFVLRNVGTTLTLATGGVLDPALATLVPVPVFWGSQVVLVVVGHLVAVVAAHAVALDRYGTAGPRAHVPLVAVMVGYTVFSLWIISRPVAA